MGFPRQGSADDDDTNEGADAGGDDVAGDGDSSDASRCGTRGGATCRTDEYCDFAAATQCGALDEGGTCTKKPQLCSLIYSPVCGCDNETYSSDCNAHAAGISVSKPGACK